MKTPMTEEDLDFLKNKVAPHLYKIFRCFLDGGSFGSNEALAFTIEIWKKMLEEE